MSAMANNRFTRPSSYIGIIFINMSWAERRERRIPIRCGGTPQLRTQQLGVTVPSRRSDVRVWSERH